MTETLEGPCERRVRNHHFLDRHAYHQIVIRDADVEIRLETRVLGKSAYASGLSKIIDLIAPKRLDPGKYDIVDLVIDEK